MIKVWLYRLALALVPLLPERFGYWLFAQVGDLVYLVAGSFRRRYLSNLKHVLGEDAPPAAMSRVGRRAARNLFKNYYDLLRGYRMTHDQVMGELQEFVGVEHLEQAIAAGKGVVGGSAHFGHFNMFIHLAAAYMHGKSQVIVPVERIEPPSVFTLVSRLRASQGIEIVPVDTAGRLLIKKLREGALIGLALDYDVTRSGQTIDFFGAPARLPDGAAALAIKYNAPLIVGFIRRLDNNKSAVVIEPPLEFQRTGNLGDDTRAALCKIAERMEYWIHRYPDQWLMFQPIWEQDK